MNKTEGEAPEKSLTLYKAFDFGPKRPKEPKATVVLVHGIAADSSSFQKALEYFKNAPSLKEMRFVAFDLLGAGKSDSSDNLNYDFKNQLAALENSIEKADISAPVILVGHSMGTFIATRFAKKHQELVKRLILVSPPIYTKENLQDPAFEVALEGFKRIVAQKNQAILRTKAFNDELEYIVANPENYQKLEKINLPTTLIYGEQDQIIAPFNIPKLLRENSQITAIKTPGTHSVSRDKYEKISHLLEEFLHA